MQDYNFTEERPKLNHVEVCWYSFVENEDLPNDRKETRKRFAFIFTNKENEIWIQIRQINESPLQELALRQFVYTFELDQNDDEFEMVCCHGGLTTFGTPINFIDGDDFVSQCRTWIRQYSHLNPQAEFGE